MEVVSGLLDFNFSKEVLLRINRIFLSHLHGEDEFTIASRDEITKIIQKEILSITNDRKPKTPYELGAHMQHRLQYWQYVHERTHRAVTLHTTRVLSRIESEKIFFTLRHLSHTLMGIVNDTPLYNDTRPT